MCCPAKHGVFGGDPIQRTEGGCRNKEHRALLSNSPLQLYENSIFQLSFLIARQTGLFPPAKIVYENVTAFATVNIQENVCGFCLKNNINFIDCGYRKGLCKDCVLPISRQLYREMLLCTGGDTAILALQKYNRTSLVSNRCESSTLHDSQEDVKTPECRAYL